MERMVEGWKGIVNYFDSIGIKKHERTFRQWHYRRLRIPFDKSSQKPQGKFVIPETLLVAWYFRALIIHKSNPP